jgi:predicted porin
MKTRSILPVSIGLAVLSCNVSALDMNMYGVGHASFDNNDDGSNSYSTFASSASRLGFSGSHDAGGGLTAIFQYESGVDLSGRGDGNDGNGGIGGTSGQIFTRARDSWVGMKGGFGKVVMGRVGGLNQWLYDYNLFADQVGDLGNIWGGSGLADRIDGALMYSIPSMSGLDLSLTYAPVQNSAQDKTSTYTVVKANYATGNLKLSLGVMSQPVFDGGTNSYNDHGVTAFVASYDMGNISLGLGIQSESDVGGVNGSDRDSQMFGASFKIGDGLIKAQYALTEYDGSSNTDGSQIAVGYDHSLNKSTTVYVAYSGVSNDAAASYSANNYGHGQASSVAAGDDPNTISVGLVFKFDNKIVK